VPAGTVVGLQRVESGGPPSSGISCWLPTAGLPVFGSISASAPPIAVGRLLKSV
jgi:hypothetical protein